MSAEYEFEWFRLDWKDWKMICEFGLIILICLEVVLLKYFENIFEKYVDFCFEIDFYDIFAQASQVSLERK